jgi:hypothetical protein
MNRPSAPNPYMRHRFPAEIISHCDWLYLRFCLSYRDVEELMAERGISLTYEAVRYWCRKFGQAYANVLLRRRPRPSDKWYLDEVFLTIHGERHYLWQVVPRWKAFSRKPSTNIVCIEWVPKPLWSVSMTWIALPKYGQGYQRLLRQPGGHRDGEEPSDGYRRPLTTPNRQI